MNLTDFTGEVSDFLAAMIGQDQTDQHDDIFVQHIDISEEQQQ